MRYVIAALLFLMWSPVQAASGDPEIGRMAGFRQACTKEKAITVLADAIPQGYEVFSAALEPFLQAGICVRYSSRLPGKITRILAGPVHPIGEDGMPMSRFRIFAIEVASPSGEIFLYTLFTNTLVLSDT